MNSDETSDIVGACLLIVVIAFLVFWGGFIFGHGIGQRDTEREAIAAGAAEWTITKDGEPQFKWKGTK
jgi:hypothetical protein